jgi:hypothetical protein
MRGEANWLPFLLPPILLLVAYFLIKKVIKKIKEKKTEINRVKN